MSHSWEMSFKGGGVRVGKTWHQTLHFASESLDSSKVIRKEEEVGEGEGGEEVVISHMKVVSNE